MKKKKLKLKRFLKLGILLFGISILLWNCKQDQNEVLETLTIEQAIPDYSQRMVRLTKIPEVEKYLNDKLPKNSFQRTNEETGIIMNFDAVLELVDSLENLSYSIRFTFDDSPEGEFFNLVVGKTAEGEMTQPRVLGFVCDHEQLETFVTHHSDMNYFKGTVSLYNYIDFFSQAERSKRSRTTTGSISIEPCDEQTYTGSGGDPYDGNNPDDWNPIDPEGTGGGSGLGDIDTSSGSGGSCTWSWGTTGPCAVGSNAIHSAAQCGAGTGVSPVLNINCGGVRRPNSSKTNDDDLGCGDPIPIGVNSEEDISVAIMKKIESSELDPCSNDILTDLKRLQQNNIANIIERFDSPNSTYNWEIKNNSLTSGTVAETDRRNNTQTFDYVTEIDSNYISQATKIAIARTILHEMLHSYMISHIDDVNAGNTVDVRQFLLLWNYIRNTTSPGGSTQTAQHEYMANRFIPHLKTSLKEYDGGTQPDQYYEDLAWGALFETDTFNHFHPVNSTSRNRIINTNAAEDTNSSQNGINPKGSPCN